jgi:Zn-dependent M16 (insulinase) family peptidase
MVRHRLLRSVQLPDYQATAELYQHPTGAQHLHLRRPDQNLAFGVAFKTLPSDSTGVAHILEHITLSGSRRYPVKSPFFAMLPRSLATFMNAFTSLDWTLYPFSTRNRKDFSNLLGVYLDATFFPLLSEWSFYREAHRLEFATGDTRSSLSLQGVVYNEMKGAMAAPASVLERSIGAALFPDLTYAFNSGGDPASIPDLTLEDLRAFHRRYYHPSNAYFYSYGDIAAEEVLEQIEELALQHFEPAGPVAGVPLQPSFPQPGGYAVRYPSDDPRAGQVLLAWAAGDGADPEGVLELELLAQVLMGHPATPLYQALIGLGLGSDLADASGLHTDFRQPVFAVGLKDVAPGQAETIERCVLETLQQAADALDPELVRSALHQETLARREISNAGFPFGLKLFLQMVNPWMYGGDPLSVLRLDSALERLRQDPAQLASRIRQRLLENPHRARIELIPDSGLAAEQAAQEAAKVASLVASLDQAGRERIAQISAELARRQEEQDQLSVLPMLGLGDIPSQLQEVEYRSQPSGRSWLHLCPQPTHGLVYADLRIELGGLDDREIDALSGYSYALTSSGAGADDYVAFARRLEAFTGGVHASLGSSLGPDGKSQSTFVRLRGKALRENGPELLRILKDLLLEPRFTEEREEQLAKERRAAMEASLVQAGHRYALSLARAQLSPLGALAERWQGLHQLDQLKSGGPARERLEVFARLQRKLRAGTAHLCLTAEAPDLEPLAPLAEALLAELSAGDPPEPLRLGAFPTQPVARTTSVPVAYNALAYQLVPFSHPDAPALAALAHWLQDNLMIRELREKGGAYGGHAGFSPRSGVFTMDSYRDPNVARTFEVFRKAAEAVSSVTEEQVQLAILSASRALDPLLSPDSLGVVRVYDDIDGYTKEVAESFLRRLKEVTAADLVRVSARLDPARAAYALVTGPQLLGEAQAALHGLHSQPV